MARLAAEQMMRNLPDDIATRTIIAVPLHRWRIWSRGFNQATLIARHLSAATGAPLAHNWVERVRHTRPLKGAGRRQREAMLRGAFAVPAKARPEILGKRILLVDDVYTSGATTNAITRVLKRSGAACVTIACWTRVLPEHVAGDGVSH